MSYVTGAIVCCIIASLAIYINLPPPELSDRLGEWKRKGKFQKFTVKGWNIFFVDEKGTGPSGSLICLHGFPSHSYDWIKILPVLKQQFSQVILFDFVGFGFSEKPQSHTYTISEQADIVEELAVSLNLKEAHVLAHDYGDTVALELLARDNNKEARFQMLSLALLNAGLFPETYHPRVVQDLLQTPIVGYVTSLLYSYSIFRNSFAMVFGANKPTEEEKQDFWAAIRYNYGERVTYKIINFERERLQFKDRWVGALKTTPIKVLMIYGPADPVNPPAFATHFRKTLPQHTLVTLDSDVGHYPQWENPSAVSAEFVKFIRSLPSSPKKTKTTQSS